MASHKEPPAPAEATRPEGYTVLARRYRPQTFAEIIGQEHVARALSNALAGNRVAHAYLFTGNRGVGKTSTARILAKALNCAKGPTPTPCGVCAACASIAAGEDVDVLEIDGASNRRIDEIRDIRSNVQYRPSRSRYKIYIIDEVHMLTKEAFNALLKTLEEPPPHVKFIFATTEVEKVPITILSRCQRFDFAGISLPRIVAHLREILQREGREADDEALERIARRAGGSMRDAQSVLDQLLAFGTDRLTAEQVHHLFGTARDDRLIALAEAILAHDPRQALLLLDEVAAGGLQMGELLDQLMAYWRDLLVVRAGAEALDLSVPPRHAPTLARQARALTLDTLLAGLDILATTRAGLRGSAHGRTLVEMALVRLGRLDQLVSLAQLSQWLTQQKLDGSRPPSGNGPVRVAPPEGVKKNSPPHPQPLSPEGRGGPDSPLSSQGRGGPDSPLSPERRGGPDSPLSPERRGGPDSPLSPERRGVGGEGAPPGPVPLTAETLPQVWAQTLATLASSGLVGATLVKDLEKGGIPAISGPNSLVLRFPAVYNQAQEHCQDPERLRRVEDILRKATGRPWLLRVERALEASRELKPGAPGTGTPEQSEEACPPRRNPREEAEKVPLVKRVMEVFGVPVQRVDDGFGTVVGKPDATAPTDES
jgi:DNA polymerase-3 subunit gamma/tau